MEMYLRQADDIIRFPVIPSSFSVDNGVIVNVSEVIKLGEIVTFGGNKLQTIDIKSFFSNQEYSFCNYKGFPKPYDFVSKLKKWIRGGYILRLTITETDINFECMITNFKPTEQDGTGDVYFELSLIEYIRFALPKIPTNTSKPAATQNKTNRPVSKPNAPTQRTYTVKKGDCLWNISRKYYGKGSDYPKIFNANKGKIKNPSLIYPGQVLVIP